MTNIEKLRSIRVLSRFTCANHDSLQWLIEQQKSILLSTRQASTDICPLNDLIICLPAAYDLTGEDLLKQFHTLQLLLKASNAKYISDAILVISRRLPTELFLNHYLDMVRHERFQTLGKKIIFL